LQASGGEATRGYQYVPDVAGATAVMYHVQDAAGNNVDYLHLSRLTVARIFMGDICNWDDPAITADNGGLVLPNQPITVVYRGGQSGTTGLFYDFIEATDPSLFATWAARNQFPTSVRIIELDTSPGFACHTQAFQGSDQIAQHIASSDGLWDIGYDEFGYARTYDVPAAWIENAAGQWVLPYAENISAALESAHLRPDLSQDLSGVYTSTNPAAYPISAYSYLVTQCAPAADRATCKGPYTNPGVALTLSRWMRYIACQGQINMARIGYSPLPPNLSQEMANSIGRMNGQPPETLTAANCPNPRFSGSLGTGASSPSDPLANVAPRNAAARAAAGAAAGGGGAGAATVSGVAALTASGAAGGSATAARGKAAQYRDADPVAYNRPLSTGGAGLPLAVLLAILVVPALILGRRRRRARQPS
jgi:phosphate transport system substrate-binding protein